jgi:hypothetical protein
MTKGIILFLASTTIMASIQAAGQQLRTPEGQLEALGFVRVITRMKNPEAPTSEVAASVMSGGLSSPAEARLRNHDDDVAEAAVLSEDLVSLTLRANVVDQLREDPNVADVFVEVPSEAYLAETVPLMGAPALW